MRAPTLMAVTMAAALAATAGTARGAEDCEREGSGNEIVGTLIGAAVGGLIGSRIGSGGGNKVAIGAGVLAGGLLGNRIGRNLDCRDRQMHGAAAQDAFEYQRSGTASTWRNPDSGNEGAITPTRTYQRADGRYCRDFQQTIEASGSAQSGTGTACRLDDGTWEILEG
ncbi:MAG: glycine zipper 2TM domain-containing protein [Ectothiorhodospiraceae bacterium]|nr:glycine zipper 2TM domain-containing protein [Chromatiales bacterium]MCP5157569.1 glycine zipper 2TM domain-containing protein [Ectothiorhodospiraceae bacterium]